MRTVIDIPAAVHVGRTAGIRWVFRCTLCNGFTLRKNRWTMAGVHICAGCATEHNDHLYTEWAQYHRDVSDAYAENETFDADRERWERNQAVAAMRIHCDVAYPDTDDSPGARWLYRLHNSVTEAWDGGRFGPDSGEDRQSVVSELADSAIEIYTHPRWQIFADLCMYDSDAELPGDAPDYASDLTDIAGYVMQEIADMGINSWLDEKIQEMTCGECGEFPCECDDDDDAGFAEEE